MTEYIDEDDYMESWEPRQRPLTAEELDRIHYQSEWSHQHVTGQHHECRCGRHDHYYLTREGSPERQVSKTQFVQAEREAGFATETGHLSEPATEGFSGHGISGRIQRR